MDARNCESEDDKDEAVFFVQKDSKAITAWKAHQLRSINQDRARGASITRLDRCPNCARFRDEAHACPVPRSTEQLFW